MPSRRLSTSGMPFVLFLVSTTRGGATLTCLSTIPFASTVRQATAVDHHSRELSCRIVAKFALQPVPYPFRRFLLPPSSLFIHLHTATLVSLSTLDPFPSSPFPTNAPAVRSLHSFRLPLFPVVVSLRLSPLVQFYFPTFALPPRVRAFYTRSRTSSSVPFLRRTESVFLRISYRGIVTSFASERALSALCARKDSV